MELDPSEPTGRVHGRHRGGRDEHPRRLAAGDRGQRDLRKCRPVRWRISLFGAGNPFIFDNVISGNTASSEGGGISMANTSDADIVQNLVVYNSAFQGGGIAALVPFGARGPLLVGNTIAHNQSPQGSGAYIDGFDDQTTLVNNVIASAAGQAAVFCGNFSASVPSSGSTTRSARWTGLAATAPTRRARTEHLRSTPVRRLPPAPITG
jgi:parallel beta-helix repeat protein